MELVQIWPKHPINLADSQGSVFSIGSYKPQLRCLTRASLPLTSNIHPMIALCDMSTHDQSWPKAHIFTTSEDDITNILILHDSSASLAK